MAFSAFQSTSKRAKGIEYNVRKTKSTDGPEIVEMLADYYLENQRKMPMDVKFDVRMTERFIKEALAHRNCISFISDDGIVLGELSQTWFGPNPVGRGLVWYVRPEARNGILAMKLLNAFDAEATSRGARYSRFELDNPANLPVVDRMLHKADYRDFSKIYLKDLRD